jgi:hypothetical protein
MLWDSLVRGARRLGVRIRGAFAVIERLFPTHWLPPGRGEDAWENTERARGRKTHSVARPSPYSRPEPPLSEVSTDTPAPYRNGYRSERAPCWRGGGPELPRFGGCMTGPFGAPKHAQPCAFAPRTVIRAAGELNQWVVPIPGCLNFRLWEAE